METERDSSEKYDLIFENIFCVVPLNLSCCVKLLHIASVFALINKRSKFEWAGNANGREVILCET